MDNKPAKADEADIAITALVTIVIAGAFLFAGRILSEVLLPNSPTGTAGQWILTAGGMAIAALWAVRRLR
ncbi:hypothetical protein [Streptomyces sp. enrichment culture]|uniref:hypothetical protein n=1 Tax=Streptomyces sp. enrichment culture TaxID=1795815 RepID=UPI003F55B906